MLNKLKKNKLLTRLLILIIIVYVAYTFYQQQKSFASYNAQQEYYKAQIVEETKAKDELISMKENLNSKEYIEKIAREKLGMYLPNERVFIDIDK